MDQNLALQDLIKARTDMYEAFKNAGSEAKSLAMRHTLKPSIELFNECMARFVKIHIQFQKLIDKIVMKYESLTEEAEYRNALIPTGYRDWPSFQSFIDDYYEDIQTMVGIKLDALYHDAVIKETASSRIMIINDLKLTKHYMSECENIVTPFLVNKNILSESAERELEGSLISFESLLDDIGEQLKLYNDILLKYPVKTQLDMEITEFESELVTGKHELKKYRLHLKLNQGLRTHAGNSLPNMSYDGLPTSNDHGRPFTVGFNSGLHGGPYHRPPTMGSVYPNYAAMRQASGLKIKSRAQKALEQVRPLCESPSQYDVAKYYLTKGGGGFFGAGGGPGYDISDGLSYPQPNDGTDNSALPFRFKNRISPFFLVWLQITQHSR